MSAMNLSDNSHRRLNPLTGEWVLVSPGRLERPWGGMIEAPTRRELPARDPSCYLCPGNARAGGARNPKYESTFVFDNDFQALQVEGGLDNLEQEGLLIAQRERGICRVICFSPRHDLTLAEMDEGAIREIVRVWADQSKELGALDFVRYVQIFENRGEAMGCSNPHPHGQIWATESVPVAPAKELLHQKAHFARTGGKLLLEEYLTLEENLGERVVCSNETWAALVPFWAEWPFETILIPRRKVARLAELNADERGGLANILKRLTTRYDNLFETSFPYTMGFHPAPDDGEAHPWWQLHAHFYPPLLRSAGVRKFRVGFEMLAMPQRDFTPEHAAEKLRAVSEIHYREKS